MSVIDQQERKTALNPLQSFCVTAPAGSGKTELLIQRYLTLLARVSRPEQVLAITFTRKAAAEMRERVLEALVEAQDGEECASSHQQQTRTLALAALAVDSRESWQLTRNISRLNIKTIDGFCSNLTRQMPVLSGFGGQAEVMDNAAELYAEAVAELFKLIESDNPLAESLATLMLHFDNNWARLQELLMAMLGRRDQWQAYIGVHHQPGESESYLLHLVDSIVTNTLADLALKLEPYAPQILELWQYSAENLEQPVPVSFPGANASDLSGWRSIRALLLTAGKTGNWRSRLDVRMGFPAGKGPAQERKDQLKQLIGEMREVEGLLPGLNGVMTLPEMESQSDSWQLVLELSRILPRLAAELLLVFQRHGKVDYSQVALSALQALGEDDLPTELALRLDYQLEHILVDEFQDTAINQYALVHRLTRGWGEHNERNPENPRTLLIVGDGMQSIYGFRDANVGLFLKARQHGFNGVALQPLSLLSNFRSDEGVVCWVNDTFALAFPDTEDVGQGQIRFTAATAVRPAGTQQAVSLQAFRGDDKARMEVEAICETVQRGIADGDCHSIAILARTRGQLQPILARFKALDIMYSAQDIDSLASSTVIMDLLSLCRALSNSADRVAWVSLLRAPWCGLTLADLHVVGSAGEFPRYSPVITLLERPELIQRLSADGRERLAHFTLAIQRAQHKRERLTLRIWVEQLWLELGGPASVASQNQLHDAERFFQLLELAEREGAGLSPDWLQAKLEKLYVQAENPASKVQIMTLHKAKGLQFDWVVIPGLQRTTRANARPLLLWDDYSSDRGDGGFLLAADDHSRDGEPTLYNWLKVQRANKEILETTRLLYVGTTRAVQHMLLTACLNYDEKKEEFRDPPARSLLSRIWPSFREQMSVQDSVVEPQDAPAEDTNRRLFRLPVETIRQLSGPAANTIQNDSADGSNLPELLPDNDDRWVGTIVHLALEQLSRLTDLPAVVSARDSHRWRQSLAGLGLFGEALEVASARVDQSVGTVLSDPVGRWILSTENPSAESELALTRIDETGGVKDIVIDRTFIDKKTQQRWLVDYKNSQPAEEESLEDFSLREALLYREQLGIYRDALQALFGQPVNCALYFTALAHMHPVKV